MGCCARCLTNLPYGSLIATILCCCGVGVFLGCLYPAVRLTLRMFEDVFAYNLEWLNNVQLVFIIIGAFMGILSITLMIVGAFSTGATRSKIYRGWKSRVGGRISSALCMCIVYLLNLVWLAMSCSLVVVVFVFHVWRHLCEKAAEIDPDEKCVNLSQFYFLFQEDTDRKFLKICAGKKKTFCEDTVYEADRYFIYAFAASVLVVISLVHYLMCLTANYTRIKDHEKIKDLQELQYLQDSEMGTLPKDRF